MSSALVEPLNAQEQRVLRLLAAGRSNPEIARELVVSINTVKAHVQSIYRKLNVNNRQRDCTPAQTAVREIFYKNRSMPNDWISSGVRPVVINSAIV